jgi:anti-sigma regulatory factor (Ser/Thr protein kinase)
MSFSAPAPFTFAVLDGLCFAAARGRFQPPSDHAYRLVALGPVLELARLSTSRLLPPPSRASWLALDDAVGLSNALIQGHTIWTCRQRQLGYLRMRAAQPDVGSDAQANETGFKLEAQRAAHAAGFPRKLAAQLVGAFEEIHGNVYDHSVAPASGLAAYRATARRFEFAVSDGGRGVLASLRSCADYTDLTDHGAALNLMLHDGVSRYGSATGRGNGFRDLFRGLANINGEIRFRSGDHAVTIEGVNPRGIPATTSEKEPLVGFVASVICSI